MIYLESPSLDPYFNLALEEYVFTAMDPREQYLMLWRNSSTVVVGKYQNTAQEINQAYVDQHGIRVARRLSGGGAVYHDTGNLNFTFVVDQDDLPDFNFQAFVQPVIRTLDGFGVHAEFNGRNDLTIQGKKFSGNSQYAVGDRLLHHGCILLDGDLEVLSSALKVRDAKIQSKGIRSVISRVTTINAHAPRPISMEEFKAALAGEIFSGSAVRPYQLTDADLRAVEALRDEKYATWAWNYGYFADYEMQRERKFPAGLVTLSMNVRDAHIQEIRLCGDFFGSGDIRELEASLVGLPLDSSLEAALTARNVPYYMNGITARDLCDLILY